MPFYINILGRCYISQFLQIYNSLNKTLDSDLFNYKIANILISQLSYFFEIKTLLILFIIDELIERLLIQISPRTSIKRSEYQGHSFVNQLSSNAHYFSCDRSNIARYMMLMKSFDKDFMILKELFVFYVIIINNIFKLYFKKQFKTIFFEPFQRKQMSKQF